MRSHSVCLLAAASFFVAGCSNQVAREHMDRPAFAAEVAPAPHAAAPHAADEHAKAPALTSEAALKLLTEGNGRYVDDKPTHPRLNAARRHDTSGGQNPFAAVLSCADSRVPVEAVFDVGIGDLFIVRVAGNVSDVDEIGTLEYGVAHMPISTIVVMGHSKCGAVTAVVNKDAVSRNIELLVDNIAPAVEEARKADPKLAGAELIAAAIRLNVKQSMADLQSHSKSIDAAVKADKVKIVGAIYDLETGKVEWLK